MAVNKVYMPPPTSTPKITKHALERMAKRFGVSEVKAKRKLLAIAKSHRWQRVGRAWIIEVGPYRVIRVGKKIVTVSFSARELNQ